MANILIIDDKKAASAFLKLALKRQHHHLKRSCRISEAMDRINGTMTDLILINQSFRNNSGWQVFNDLKKKAPNFPMMVYVLNDLTVQCVDWIVKSVASGIENSKRDTTSLGTREMG